MYNVLVRHPQMEMLRSRLHVYGSPVFDEWAVSIYGVDATSLYGDDRRLTS